MAAANRALEINPELAEAHAALAYSNLYDWNWSRAQEGFERAIALNPNYAPAHLWFAHYLAARGQFDRHCKRFGWRAIWIRCRRSRRHRLDGYSFMRIEFRKGLPNTGRCSNKARGSNGPNGNWG